MSPPADFAAAHRRHWNDAEFLFGDARLANADQLYGFSAECGLKAVMKGLKMPVDSSGSPKASQHRKHVQYLWPEFKRFVKGRNAWLYLKRLPDGSPFSDWSHHDRYRQKGYAREEGVNQHRDAARGILRMVQVAKQNGTL